MTSRLSLRDVRAECPAPDPDEWATSVAQFRALPLEERLRYEIALVGDLHMVLAALREEGENRS